MPRVEVIAQWRHPENGQAYESMVASIGCDVFTGAHMLSIQQAVADAKELERGPITDMAQNCLTGKSHYEEKQNGG
jgi:hypothetical protein